ncbi:GH25 family lysozyme [Rummeliibacillus sp. JY-2-4R]
MGKIVDLSKWQPTVNYKQLSTEAELAILRVQDGSTIKDEVYQNHANGCNQYNIPFGVYAFTRFINIEDAKVEARDFYTRALAYGQPKFFVADVEVSTMRDMRAGTNAYIAELRKLGAEKVGIYVAHHLYDSLQLDYAKADFTWIPRYAVDGKSIIAPDYPCDLHQYTDSGKITGIEGNVDLNRLTGTKQLSWFTGNSNSIESYKIQFTTKNSNIYIVKSGDTLSEIAKNNNTTIENIVKINKIKDANKIYIGQKLKLSHK